MKTQLFLALLFAGLLAFSVASSGESDESGDSSGSGSMEEAGDSFEKQDDECDGLVEGSDDDDKEGKCELTDGLEEIAEECDCTPDQKSIIIAWITKLKLKLKVKGSIEIRLISALTSIEEFQSENPEIYELMQYKKIKSWGFFASFSKVVQFRQSKKVEWLTTLDEDDNCPLFDFLYNCTGGSSEQENAVAALINGSLIEICGDSSLSVTKKNVKIFKALSKFFAINAEWQASFFKYVSVEFGSFQQYFEITKTFYQKQKVDTVLEGEVSECEFIVSFKKQLEIIKADASISISIKASLQAFYKRILEQLSFKVKGKARLTIIIREFRSFRILYPDMCGWIFNMQIDGFGSFWDLFNCGPWKIGFEHSTKPTAPQCSCSCSPSTISA